MALRPPNIKFDTKNARIETLQTEPIVRVYNWVDAATKGYEPLAYKQYSALVPPTGRFDGTRDDQYGQTYFGVGEHALSVALWETVFNKARPLDGADHLILLEAEVMDLAFRYLENDHACPHLILCDAESCGRIGASPDLCWSEEYAVTREWATYIRSRLPSIHGIRYMSRQSGAIGLNLVTFDDRCRAVRSYDISQVEDKEYKYSDPDGKRVFSLLASEQQIEIRR